MAVHPAISICIPAYKQPELVRRAVESVLSQSFGDFELIITDDTPDDSVKSAVSPFLTDPRVQYKKNQESLGSPRNWNEAMRLATGKYLKILHHDDRLSGPDSLQKMVTAMEQKPSALLGFCWSRMEDTEGRYLATNQPSEALVTRVERDPRILFTSNTIGAPSAVMVRRIDLPSFDPNFKWVVDFDWYIELLSRQPEIVYVREPLITICQGAVGQVTLAVQDDAHVQLFEYFRLYQKLSRTAKPPRYCDEYLLGLMHRFNIRSAGQLIEFGVESTLAESFVARLPLYRAKHAVRSVLRSVLRFGGLR